MSHEGNDWIFEKQHEEETERMANKFQVIIDAISEMKEDKYYSDLHDKVAALGKGKGKQVYNDELNSLIDFVRKVEKEY